MQHWDVFKPLKLVCSHAFVMELFVLLRLWGTERIGVCCSTIYIKPKLFVLC